MLANAEVDWLDCPLVEINPRVQGGVPVLRGTRMPLDAIIDNVEYGVSAREIAHQFEIPLERVEAVLRYVRSHRTAGCI